jgi:hypothetical protein
VSKLDDLKAWQEIKRSTTDPVVRRKAAVQIQIFRTLIDQESKKACLAAIVTTDTTPSGK